jgi:hypothetical protein
VEFPIKGDFYLLRENNGIIESIAQISLPRDKDF